MLKKYKGRLVAKGCSQQPGIDYAATFAPVTSAPSLRVILSLAALNEKSFETFSDYIHKEGN